MFRPTINTVRDAIKAIKHIPRPEGDNEGDPINCETVFPYLSPSHQEQVCYAEEILYDYTRSLDGQPNRRAINTLTRNGYPASLDQSQENHNLLSGQVCVDGWKINISDSLDEPCD